MRILKLKKQFKKDFKKSNKNPRHDISQLAYVIDLLAEHGELPTEYRAHQLVGNWTPKLECHIQPNFLLIYEVDDINVILYRCGSHSELFS
jgi:mRNA interferase YafQ